MRLHELQEARSQAVVAMRTLTDLAATESRDLTEAESRSFDESKAKVVAFDKQIARAQAVAEFERSAPAVVHGRLGDGAFEERARDFSITRAIRASLPRDLGGGDVDAGFEREMSQEVARRSGRKFEGIAVPDQAFMQERRTLLAGSTAADLVPNVHRADMFIDVLRNRLVCARLGATYLDGLVGSPIDVPRQTGSSTAQWVAEDGSLSETDASFDDVSFTPKTVGAMTSYSRRTLLNASPSIEQIIRNDLAAIIANAIDAKAMLGDGTSNTPTGIVNSGAQEIAASTSLSWEEVLQFIASVEGDNALMGSLGWAINPHVKTKLRSTTKVTSDAGAGFVMDDPNSLAGYPAVATSALPGNPPGSTPTIAGSLIFGDWTSLMIGSWTGVDILVNPYETTAYAKGRVLVRALKDVDVQVRHVESFAFANDLVTDA
jgi:HK97 family phage major capsid protein